ncbi:MAG TPA: CHY zinc finger protein [Gemmatimonadaceae bacterium]|nr:CHY zinc finger protein [Gemmatimonadaceae bacterium]
MNVDEETRCAHYHSPLDIIAIKLRCCGSYYACKECHDALADHSLAPWPAASFDTHAILCGACGAELTINEYLGCGSRCPRCAAGFNPGCARHHHFYFSIAEPTA